MKMMEYEVEQQENKLFHCALAVEQDIALQEEMVDWDVTLNDGLNDEEFRP
jgi:hypothetical protein